MTTTLPPLANLCESCRVLELDDSKWPAYIGGSDSGGYYLDIVKEHLKSGRFHLDYFVLDSLPDLPDLSNTAQKGCDFCSVLKRAIQSCARDSFNEVVVSLFYQCPISEESGDGGQPIGIQSLVAQLLWTGYENNGDHLIRSTWLRFDLDSPPGHVAQLLRLESPPRDEALCAENIGMILRNLKQSNHIRSSEVGTVYPTRLVDVGLEGTDLCRLIETTSDASFKRSSDIPYATLSYCWGSPEDSALQFKTERSSLHSRLSGFRIDQVSPILHDAIRVTQALGVRYLWVDAVCIIQDDDDDWDRESSRMSYVYQNATLTICTAASTSCQQGFLGREWIATRIRFQSKCNKKVSGSYTLRLVGEVEEGFHAAVDSLSLALSHSYWGLRGWVLQEYELSQRALIFGKTKLHIITENGFQSEPKETIETSECAPGTLYIKEAQNGYYREYLNFLSLIENYSTRMLSNRSDKLAAISGLASRSLSAYPGNYLAGHMFPHIDLFWTAMIAQIGTRLTKTTLIEQLQSRESYIAPSWSWASRNHLVAFGDGRSSLVSIESDFSDVRAECDIVQSRVLPAGLNPFGGVKYGGSLVIRSTVVPISLHVQLFPMLGSNIRLCRATEEGQYVTNLNFDWNDSEDAKSFEELSLVLLGSRKAENISWEPVQVIYEHELVDQSEQLESDDNMKKFPNTVPTVIIKGLPAGARAMRDDERLVYGLYPDQTNETSERVRMVESIKTGNSSTDTTKAHRMAPNKTSMPSVLGSGTPKSGGERYAYGIIIHPASEPGKYLRVGVFHSVPRERGGLDYFRGYPARTVEII
ncbi:HET-domain-containing protein [Hypomontagnella monticulosa]|nr:HET-domain-containing protein [Hypomontagnella monticulosa]